MTLSVQNAVARNTKQSIETASMTKRGMRTTIGGGSTANTGATGMMSMTVVIVIDRAVTGTNQTMTMTNSSPSTDITDRIGTKLD